MRIAHYIPFILIILLKGYRVVKIIVKYKNNLIFKLLSKPGLLLQKIITKQSNDDKLEVAIKVLENDFGDNLSKFTSQQKFYSEAIQ